MVSPYENRPPRSFWRSVVASAPDSPPEIFVKRFEISRNDKIAAAGSCFAQHILAALVKQNYNVIDVEPAPRGLLPEHARYFGYGVYSARYGNVYTARQMLQLAREAFGLFEPTDIVWEKGGRFYDAMRPSVEPDGLASAEEVLIHRADHIRRVREMLTTASLLVFTLGLTEAWTHTASGTVYPTAPETIAGHFDPTVHSFHNFSFDEVVTDLTALRDLLQAHNPDLRFLFTVSPVPLAATASDAHVLVATTYSKSVLRAAAGAMYDRFQDVDYFPSYEIISAPFLNRRNYEADLRSIRPKAVARVMRTFFDAHRATDADQARISKKKANRNSRGKSEDRARQADEDVICEEKLLEAFAE